MIKVNLKFIIPKIIEMSAFEMSNARNKIP